MPKIISVAEFCPPNEFNQNLTEEFAQEMFQESFKDVDRLLKVFKNGQVEKRYFSQNIHWYKKQHSFEEKNTLFVDCAKEYGVEVIKKCLSNKSHLKRDIHCSEIDAIFFITSTGISTPSIEARIMNMLPFKSTTKRIPIWGLGCAGGASGLTRAYEYCKAFKNSKVLVLTIELCSLTFQKNDLSKSNLIGTSLFADGVACACVIGDEVNIEELTKYRYIPSIIDSRSVLMQDSEDVMGWEVKNEGLYVIFSKDIPKIVEKWLKPIILNFLTEHDLDILDIAHFIGHPGGKKVLDAYVTSLSLEPEKVKLSAEVLKNYGNMSSATVLYVLNRFLSSNLTKQGDYGLITALGPGFSSENLLVQWR
ncbi:type III polyketide synthase [Bacillus timonensis]|nr:type III polyketide synthase [Bacillus timonensis]